MAVKEGKIPVGDTGKDLDTTVVEQTDGSAVHREVVVLGDPEHADRRTHLDAIKEADVVKYAMPVSGPELVRMEELMRGLIVGQKITHMYLSHLGNGVKFSADDIEE